MTLRVVEHVGRSDVGRQRSVNEDSLVLDPPFFAVADGMGGAKAGEVASAMAAGAFEGESDSGEPAEAQLSRILRAANRRIYDLAVTDDSHRGMGTTVTAAKVSGDDVSLGHVGDSRAYRMRDGQLEQLTRDHSLVAELERSGQITPEAAEHHPQRSIITRALGPEPDVQVDTYTLAGRPDDLFLICSDGLTSMISDDELGSILRVRHEPGGGRRVAGPRGQPERRARTTSRSCCSGSVTSRAARGSRARTRRSPASCPRPTCTKPPSTRPPSRTPSSSWRECPPTRPWWRRPCAARAAAPRRKRGSRLKALAKGLAALAVLAAVGTGLYALSRQVYFVGTNDAGLVTLYRGVPYELPFGIDLYEEEYASGVPARAIPSTRRERVLDHEWRGRQDAEDLLRTLERGQLSG